MEQSEATTVKFPNILLVPAEVGTRVIQQQITPWELRCLLTRFGEGNSERVRQLLKPARRWATHVAVQTQEGGESNLKVDISLVIRTLPSLIKCLSTRLVETINFKDRDTWPPGLSPTFPAPQNSQAAAQAAMVTVLAAQQ